MNGTLSVSVRDESAAAVLGNVFITVTAAAGGDTHRELRYDARRERYVFPRLRSGDYDCRITAAGYEPETRAVRVDSGPASLDVILRPRRTTAPLVIPITEEWPEADAAAAAIWTHRTPPWPDNVALETTLLVAFLRDPDILDVLTAPIHELDLPAGLVPYLHEQISANWTFMVGATAAAALVKQLAESRARLYAMTRSVFRNDAVCAITGRLSESELHSAALELIRSLDSLELVEILPLLMRASHPERVPVADFVQAAVDLFGAQLPPRVARRRRTLPPLPSPPSLAGDPGEPRDELVMTHRAVATTLDDDASAHSPRVAAIARAAAWAIRHSRGRQ